MQLDSKYLLRGGERKQQRKQRICILLLLAISLLGLKSTCSAELVWDNPHNAIHPAADVKVVHTSFTFQNKGKESVTITDAKASCGCTAVVVTKKVIAPGKRGSVDVTYQVGEQMGLQIKIISISTNDPKNPLCTVFLEVYLPEWLKFSTRYVFWDKGSAPDPQTITISATKEKPIRILSVTSNTLDITAKLQAQKEGQEYSVQVAPVNTQGEARGIMEITTDWKEDGMVRKFYLYADVKAIPKTILANPH